MKRSLLPLLTLALGASALAGPKVDSYKGYLSEPADKPEFVRFITSHVGETVKLTLVFARDPSPKHDATGLVGAPYGYKGSKRLAIFAVGDGKTFWIQGVPKGQTWKRAVNWNEKTYGFSAKFRITRNRKAGGGRWYDLTLVK